MPKVNVFYTLARGFDDHFSDQHVNPAVNVFPLEYYAQILKHLKVKLDHSLEMKNIQNMLNVEIRYCVIF